MDRLFRSFLQAGFECSTHKLRDGTRLDLLSATSHDEFAVSDFSLLESFGIRTVRTGARWHLIEQAPGSYDFRSLEKFFRAAEEAGIEILLDLLHFGWPDDIDIFDTSFPDRLGDYAAAVAKFIKPWSGLCNTVAPVNEISFLSWAGGDVAAINPYTEGRGAELKRILVRAAVVASEVLLSALPHVRLLSPEPVIHIVGDPTRPGDDVQAERHRLSQFEAWDMLCGRQAPELGGRPEYLDIIGTNFYDRNQWVNHGETLLPQDPRYRPFHKILQEVWERYGRPILVSETGTEGDARADWFNYVCREVSAAERQGIPVHGLCLYPILNHPGWEDERHCHNGLFDYADTLGNRPVFQPLAEAINKFQEQLLNNPEVTNERESNRSTLFFSPSLELRVPTPSTSDDSVRETATCLLC